MLQSLSNLGHFPTRFNRKSPTLYIIIGPGAVPSRLPLSTRQHSVRLDALRLARTRRLPHGLLSLFGSTRCASAAPTTRTSTQAPERRSLSLPLASGFAFGARRARQDRIDERRGQQGAKSRESLTLNKRGGRRVLHARIDKTGSYLFSVACFMVS